ncbi:MAG: substrate-binding domain-containing protein [Candidatus Izemoplasmatales bacterium]|jgi:ribose transport system substrate-binding protein|nr:substrate-binding domain-containing protein [Candidatus Izemoplasmatales bacterium]
MKKLITVLMLLFTVVALAACNGGSDKKEIAVIMPSADHGFLGESINHAEAATERLAEEYGYNFQFLISDDIVEQASQIDKVIADGVDVVVLWPHNGDELKSAAQAIVDAEIPLIIYDRLISDFNETAELLGDNVTIGEETGEYFNTYFADELAAGEVKILEFKGDNSSVPTQRSEGFWSTANENFVKFQEWSTNWSKDTAQSQMETFLTTASQADVESIKAIFTHDAEVAAGVLAALEGYEGSYSLNIELVSAVSASRELLSLFDHYEALGINQVVFSFSPAMVVDAIQLGIDVLEGETVSGQYLVPTEMVDNTNFETFMQGPVYTLRYSLED